jgi:hypothetical protein
MLIHLPGVDYAAPPRAAARTSTLTWPPRLVVIHDTGNATSSRYDEAHYASNRTDSQSHWTSAHFYVDAGGVLGSLNLNLRAWAAYSYANQYGFHLEICNRDLANADALQWAAWVTYRLCQEAGIPMRKLTPTQVANGERGVCGHRDITLGLGVGDHTDPGADFDWPSFMNRVTGASAPLPLEDEDDMGQSFGPIEIQREGTTSLCIPPVQQGIADPRQAWLNICNDGGPYALRLWLSDGANWHPIPEGTVMRDEGGTLTKVGPDGLLTCMNGKRYSYQLPTGTSCVSITRRSCVGDVATGEPLPPFAGHLTVCFERA